jgi:osmotically-inducible protein OsmY
VVVEDSTVTLDGTVSSWNEKDYATTLAGEVQGVRQVINEMEIDFVRPRTNEENRDEILAAINRDPYLTGLPITVRVAGDVATLEGSVGNVYEKDRAAMDARRVGSVVVVHNLLAVDWLDERGVREGSPLPADDEIRRATRDSLDEDLRLTRPGDLTVQVAHGVVTLEGRSPDFYQASIARQDCRDVLGVERVVDLVDIRPSEVDDQALLGVLERVSGADYALVDTPIGVSFDDGVATLTGEVNSAFEREHAEEVAAEVLGVRGLINGLVVQPAVGRSDEALREIIEARLAANWKTAPVAPRIEVVVEDGTATLTGQVDTWSELLEAGRTSRLIDAVTEVINQLTLINSARPAILRSERRDDEASG